MKIAKIITLLLWAYTVTGQDVANQQQLQVQIHKHESIVNFELKSLISDASKYGFSEGVNLKIKYSTSDRNGIQHHRYAQEYDGLPVVGGVVTFHESDGLLLSSTGVEMENISVVNEASMTSRKAEANAVEYVVKLVKQEQPAVARMLTKPTTKNNGLVVIGTDYPSKSLEYRKAYHIQVDAHSRLMPVSRDVYVDATTGEVISSLTRVAHEHVPATGRGVFYPEATFLVDSVAPDRFLMQDATRGGGIVVRSINTGEIIESNDNTWEYDTDGEASAVDVYYATGKYYDFMLDRFDRKSIDDEDFPLEANVNFVGLVNAFWNGSQAFFGAGNCNAYLPLTNMEIVSHEYTHGLTQFTSGLIYRGQSGGLNEGMSDIFGKALEYYEDSERFNWYIGKTIARDPEVTNPFRSMEDPNERFSPKYYKGQFWSDLGGVHRLSGVLNHWFYLMVEGGMGTNEVGYEYNVPSMGMDDAIQLVYHLQTNFLVPTSDYPEAFELSKLSCEMLYGADSPQMESMLEAWATVGLSDEILNTNDLIFKLELPQVKTTPDLTCADILEDLTVVLRYEGSEELPASSTVSGAVLIYEESSGDLLHTLPIEEQTLLEAIGFGDSITIQVGAPSEVETFSVRVEVRAEILTDSGLSNVVLDQTFRIADGRVPNVSMTIDYEDECDKSRGVERAYLFVGKPSCRPSETAPLRIELTGPTGTISVDEVATYEDGSSGTFVFGIHTSLGLPEIEDLVDYEARVFYIDEAGVANIVETFDFSQEIKEQLLENQPITFDGDLGEDFLTIDESVFGLVNNLNDRLVISGGGDDDIEDCLPIDLYYEALASDNRYRTNITFCTRLQSQDATLSMEVRFRSDDETASAYQHLMQIFQGNTALLPEAKTAGVENGEQIEVQLNKDGSQEIRIEVITLGGGRVTLDDIELKSIVSTNDVQGTEHVNHDNLVTDQLRLFTDDLALPANVKIFTLDGQLVVEDTWTDSESKVLQVNDFQSGMYVLTVEGSDGYLYSGKVIKID